MATTRSAMAGSGEPRALHLGVRMRSSAESLAQRRQAAQAAQERLDEAMGFRRLEEGAPRVGWLLNMLPTSLPDGSGGERSAVDLFFLQQSGDTFKATVAYRPYFYVYTRARLVRDVAALLERKYEGRLAAVEVVHKEDLDMPNHLSGARCEYIRLSFHSVHDLMGVKAEIMPAVRRNRRRRETQEAFGGQEEREGLPDEVLDALEDAREYDVPYHVRVAIDNEIRVGAWYRVAPRPGGVEVELLRDMVVKAEPRVLAFDIECTKAPLKFPDSSVDQVFMISYMVDGEGFLIINREVVSQDVDDFEYTPKPEYPGPFTVFNEV